MADFTITMHSTPGISAEERRRRLHLAYTILIDTAREARERKAMKDEQQGSDVDER